MKVGRAEARPFATASAELSKSGGFAKIENGQHIIQVKDAAGVGAAYGKIQELTSSKIVLANSLGNKSEEFVLDQYTVPLALKNDNQNLAKEGSLADLKLGQIIQISFLTLDSGQYLATAIIQLK